MNSGLQISSGAVEDEKDVLNTEPVADEIVVDGPLGGVDPFSS